MKTSRPMMHSAPIRAPVRTCARCQMLVPRPTVTSASRSAEAWTRAEGSITGLGAPLAGCRMGSASTPRPETEYSRGAGGVPERALGGSVVGAATGPQEEPAEEHERHDGEPGPPVEHGASPPLDPPRDDHPRTP